MRPAATRSLRTCTRDLTRRPGMRAATTSVASGTCPPPPSSPNTSSTGLPVLKARLKIRSSGHQSILVSPRMALPPA
jgi:hypothetical protein